MGTKITRKTQRVFAGDVSATGVVAQFGSLKAGSPAYSSDPDVIQALAAFGGGFGPALINAPDGKASPALQDFNALMYLVTRQVAYTLAQGMPEWDVGQEYFINGFCSVDGVVFISKTNNNTGNDPVTDTNNWKTLASTLLSVSDSVLKARVCFNGFTGGLYSQFNVSSVTRLGTGAYQINFINALADENYGFTGSAGTPQGTPVSVGDDNVIVGGVSGQPVVKSTTQLNVYCMDQPARRLEDSNAISVFIA